jgi:hypothetical protein
MVCSVVFACRVVTCIVVTCVCDLLLVVDLLRVRNQGCSARHVIEFWSGLIVKSSVSSLLLHRTKTGTMVRLDGKRLCSIVLMTAKSFKY